MSFRSKSSGGELNGILDAGSHLDGELRFEQTFRVDGRITGKIVSSGDLIIGERGEIDGEIDVGSAYIAGTVRGRIEARRRLEIAAGARVYAELVAPTLVIESGAFFEGKCAMERRDEKPEEKSAPAAMEPSAKVVGRIPAVKER
ncbi:MAG: polymer-forming cytoskeletal protein [Acidobacteria bacterium]|nr:polymer-forming cytoskeletal protein [Acidobacteriota bacterium]MCB9378888.1 polymer-forming cytoskeletal protein [Holophagales bacterium]